MRANAVELMQGIPGASSEKWPHGARFASAFSHGSMSVELYAPIGSDPQTPHEQDELYIIHLGHGVLVIEGEAHRFEAGDCFLVRAGQVHRFEEFSSDFATWVIFWGPRGGEAQTVQLPQAAEK